MTANTERVSCRFCSRPLRTREARAVGYGQKCGKRMGRPSLSRDALAAVIERAELEAQGQMRLFPDEGSFSVGIDQGRASTAVVLTFDPHGRMVFSRIV